MNIYVTITFCLIHLCTFGTQNRWQINLHGNCWGNPAGENWEGMDEDLAIKIETMHREDPSATADIAHDRGFSRVNLQAMKLTALNENAEPATDERGWIKERPIRINPDAVIYARRVAFPVHHAGPGDSASSSSSSSSCAAAAVSDEALVSSSAAAAASDEGLASSSASAAAAVQGPAVVLIDQAERPAPQGRLFSRRNPITEQVEQVKVMKTVSLLTTNRLIWKVGDVDEKGEIINVTPVPNHAWVGRYNRKVAEILLQGESAVGKIITEGPARGEVLKRQTYGENGDEYFWVKQRAEVNSRIILYYIRTHQEEGEMRPCVVPSEVWNLAPEEFKQCGNGSLIFGIDQNTPGRTQVMRGNKTFDASQACAICMETLANQQYVSSAPCGIHIFCSECIEKWVSSHAKCPVCNFQGIAVTKLHNHVNAQIRGRRQ